MVNDILIGSIFVLICIDKLLEILPYKKSLIQSIFIDVSSRSGLSCSKLTKLLINKMLVNKTLPFFAEKL